MIKALSHDDSGFRVSKFTHNIVLIATAVYICCGLFDFVLVTEAKNTAVLMANGIMGGYRIGDGVSKR